MKKAGMLVMVLLVAAAMVFAGCGGTDDAQQNQGQPNQQEQQNQQQEAQQGQEGTQNETQNETRNDEAQKVQADVEQVTLTGKFNGLADSHSVEVDLDGEATVFQFSEEGMLERLEVMEEGTEIKFDAEFETGTNVRRMVKLYE